MRALKFFTNQLRPVTFTHVDDRGGWEQVDVTTTEILCLPQVKYSAVDPATSVEMGLSASVSVFVHESSVESLLGFGAGDKMSIDGNDFEIVALVPVKEFGVGKILNDFPMKVVGAKK